MNPELKRNLWLETSVHRMVAMPVVIGLMLFMLDLRQSPESLAYTALWGIGLLTMLWGARQASESMVEEFTRRTWDWQRMSTQSPWAMTWGKLFGSTVYSWYGAAIFLVAYALNIRQSLVPAREAVPLALIVCGFGLLLQCWGLLLTLHFARRNRQLNQRETLGILGLSWLLALPFLPLTLHLFEHDPVWYGFRFDGPIFGLGSLFVFVVWSLLGAYHLMRLELQFTNPPWAWVGFLLFNMAYLAGFATDNEATGHVAWPNAILLAFFSVAPWVYLLLLSDPKDIPTAHFLARAWRRRQWRDFFRALPRWLPTLVLSILAALAIQFVPGPLVWEQDGEVKAIVLSMTCLLVRDVSLVLWLSLAANHRRADQAAVIYLVVLYLVLPMAAAGVEAPLLNALLWPQTQFSGFLLLPLAEAVGMFLLLWPRLRRVFVG